MTPTAPGGAPRAFETRPEVSARKEALRSRALARRAADPARDAADAARLPLLLDASRGHAVVACYVSLPPEPDTRRLIEALSDAGVRVLLPLLHRRRHPAWGWYAGPDSLVAGWRGIPEPGGPALPVAALAEASLVWVSALLVDADGVRLGTGGGWYDRALTHLGPDAVVATLVDDREVVDALPRDPWDVPVRLVVTQTRVLRLGPAGG